MRAHTHRRAADKRRNTLMSIPCVEAAKCSPVIRWWCSGFCSLWLIISSFQSMWKQPINFIQVLIQLLRRYMQKVGRGWAGVGRSQKQRTREALFRPVKGHEAICWSTYHHAALFFPFSTQSACYINNRVLEKQAKAAQRHAQCRNTSCEVTRCQALFLMWT